MEYEIKLLKQDIVRLENDWIVPKHTDMRLIYLLSIISPWVGFLIVGMRRFGGVERQFGNADIYFELAFARSVWALFLPFLIYGTISMCLLLSDPSKYVEYWFVRLGVYVGTILSLQFTIQLFNNFELSTGLELGYIFIVPLFVLNWLIRSRHESRWADGALWIITVLFVILIFTGFGILLVILGFLAAGVVLCPIFGVITAYRLFVYVEKKRLNNLRLKLLSSLGWLTAYGITVFFAIDRVFKLYEQLPAY